MPRGLQVPGKERMMLALALVLAVPLFLPCIELTLPPEQPSPRRRPGSIRPFQKACR